MRTTVDIPEDLHRLATSIARDRHQTLSQAVVELIRRGLAPTDQPKLSISPITGLVLLDLGAGTITEEDVRSLDDDE